MVVTHFCPNCWEKIKVEAIECPHCGYNLSEFDCLSYEEKLILALNHPVRENRMMAIRLLGDLKSHRALPVLESILETEEDFHVIRDIVCSLAKIESKKSGELIQRLRDHKSKLVRKLAEEITIGGDVRN